MADDPKQPSRSLVPVVMGLRPQTFAELERLAEWAAASTVVPKDYIGKPANCFIAMQMGSELGLAPLQALQNIAVIGGRPTVWGDAMLALCWQSPLCEGVDERIEGTGQQQIATCVAKRRTNSGISAVERRFSVEDAIQAQLWGKTGPWTFYPTRMLQLRARAFALRDAFPDVLRGLANTEEVLDSFEGVTLEGTATPMPDAPPPATPPAPPQQDAPPAPPQAPPQAPPAEPTPSPTPPPSPTPTPPPAAAPAGNGAAPNGDKKQTLSEFLDGIEMGIDHAASAQEIGNILTNPRVIAAKNFATGAALERLTKLLARGLAKGNELEGRPPS